MKKSNIIKILKWTFLSIIGLVLVLVLFGVWFFSLIEKPEVGIENTTIGDLPYLSEDIISNRGKILVVVTSTDVIGNTEKATGYELTELSRAYYVFKANGFDVDIASPKGGKPPVVIDHEDMGAYDFAFLNDTVAQQKANNTISIDKVNPYAYQAVYFAGGKGAMFDFPDNTSIQSLIKNYYKSNKVIGAVCHGPAALVNVTLDNGRPLLENKTISGFTNEEELLLISDAKTIFPFLLQDKIVAQGAKFDEGNMYLEHVTHDHNLITGQNPWSTWKTAETMIKQLSYDIKPRKKTSEENAVKVLLVYNKKGSEDAKQTITQLINEGRPVSRNFIAQHAMVAVMKGEVSGFVSLLKLVSFVKNFETN